MHRTVYTGFAQNTRLWDLIRLGTPTASCFATVMRQGQKANTASTTRDRYMRCLIAELRTGNPTINYSNRQMERGHAQQDEAVEAYLQTLDPAQTRIERPAFIAAADGALLIGCSPDLYVRTTQQGGAEIKTMEGHVMQELEENPDVPAAHLPQLYGCMLVTGAEWWDFVAYCPGFRLFKKRVWRDQALIGELEAGLRLFTREMESRILKTTGETLVTHRKRHMERFQEALAEEQGGGDEKAVATGPAVDAGTDGVGQPGGLAADLRASVEQGV